MTAPAAGQVHEIAWPYDWAEKEASLDPERIERDAMYMLYRALNLRSMVAFVGSGMSMLYGRVSWTELVENHVSDLLTWHKRYSTYKDQTGTLGPSVEQLIHNLSLLGIDNDKTDASTLQFGQQLCEQIWNAVAAQGPRSSPEPLSVRPGTC